MPLLDDPTASFIVRIWLESNPPHRAEWRGSIERVASGRREFFLDLASILEFIEPYLDQLRRDAPPLC